MTMTMMARITRNLLTDYLIDYLRIDLEREYEVISIPARNLLKNPQRIDLMAKWLYIDAVEQGIDLKSAEKIYLEHIEAFTRGSFVEPGKDEKNTGDRFLEDFRELIAEFKVHDFDPEVSLIPVGKDDVLLDGAHRCICAAYFNKSVTIVRFPEVERNFDYTFFRENLLGNMYLDKMALQYCRLNSNIFCACFWPVAGNEELQERSLKIIRSECGAIIYERYVKLNYIGIYNFMIQIYGHQAWAGTYENNHEGIRSKADNCYEKGRQMRVIFFECSSLDKVIQVKAEIREMFCLENHAIHISDNDDECRAMAELLLNENSVHHLCHSQPDADKQFNAVFRRFASKVHKYGLEDRYVIDASGVLAIYGIREAGDLDYLTDLDEQSDMVRDEKMDRHDSQLKYYPISLKDMLYNPENYFVYNGIRFVKPDIVCRMKQKRGEAKDKRDVRLIRHFFRKHRLWPNKEAYANRIAKYRRKHKMHIREDSWLGWCIGMTRAVGRKLKACFHRIVGKG